MAERSHGHSHGAGIRASVGLVTVSDTRTAGDDRTGALARGLIESAGHGVFRQEIVPDEPARIRPLVESWIDDAACDAIVTCGGTGIAARDRTFEALTGLFDLRLDGFGELFRMLSWDQVGSAAMLSRAVAGVARATPLFVLPGSPAAVELALERLILPELGHVLAELRRGATMTGEMADIQCKRCGRRAESLERAPLPGPAGVLVHEGTCRECWEAWKLEQVKLINEEQLSPVNPEHFERMVAEMKRWLALTPSPGRE